MKTKRTKKGKPPLADAPCCPALAGLIAALEKKAELWEVLAEDSADPTERSIRMALSSAFREAAKMARQCQGNDQARARSEAELPAAPC